jgi:predicted transcriptional regulator
MDSKLLSMTEIMERAGISNETFYRLRDGKNVHTSTIERATSAIKEALKKHKEGCEDILKLFESQS